MCNKVVTVSILDLASKFTGNQDKLFRICYVGAGEMTQQKSRVLAPQGDWNSRLNILVWWLTTAYNSRSREGDSMLSSGLIEHLHACVHTPQTYSVSQHACVYMPHTHPFSHMYMYSHTYIHRHTNKIKYFLKNHYSMGYVCVILFGFVPQLLGQPSTF